MSVSCRLLISTGATFPAGLDFSVIPSRRWQTLDLNWSLLTIFRFVPNFCQIGCRLRCSLRSQRLINCLSAQPLAHRWISEMSENLVQSYRGISLMAAVKRSFINGDKLVLMQLDGYFTCCGKSCLGSDVTSFHTMSCPQHYLTSN